MGEIVSLNKLGSEDLAGTTGEKTTLADDTVLNKFQPPTIPTSKTAEQDITAPTTMLGGGTDASSRDTTPGLSVDASEQATYERGDATEKEHVTPGQKLSNLPGSGVGKILLYVVVGVVLWKFLKN